MYYRYFHDSLCVYFGFVSQSILFSKFRIRFVVLALVNGTEVAVDMPTRREMYGTANCLTRKNYVIITTAHC
jgi:hypothetical protein